ncbi:hypothetical protein FB451DRAFT_136616 [Mycena latifolia]|nr:hypothetical protein FB451DRAFT_136616 [Mycena latifolia]
MAHLTRLPPRSETRCRSIHRPRRPSHRHQRLLQPAGYELPPQHNAVAFRNILELVPLVRHAGHRHLFGLTTATSAIAQSQHRRDRGRRRRRGAHHRAHRHQHLVHARALPVPHRARGGEAEGAGGRRPGSRAAPRPCRRVRRRRPGESGRTPLTVRACARPSRPAIRARRAGRDVGEGVLAVVVAARPAK